MQALHTAQTQPPPGDDLTQRILAHTQNVPVLLQAFKPQNLGDPLPPYWQARPLLMLETYLRRWIASAAPPALTDKPRLARQIFVIEACRLDAAVWRPLARELVKRLRPRHLPVQFLHCQDVPTHDLLGAYHEQPAQALILIFGDSQRIRTRQHQQAVQALRQYPQLLWFELRDPRAWDVRTWLLLQQGLRVYPAQVNSIVQACRDLLSQRPPPYTAQQLQGLKKRRGTARLPARVERVVGDALHWAQACAMLPPPLGLGFAEQLRQACFPQLSEHCIERLCSLPEVRRQAEALYLSPPVLAILRSGFARQSATQQERVLGFLQQQVAAAEPDPQERLAHQEWQWYQARLQLDIEPDAALLKLSRLAQQTPLKTLIERDLAQLRLPAQRHGLALYHRIPLRRAPQSRQALRILQSFSADCGLSPQLLNPLQHFTQDLRDKWHQIQQRAALVAAFSADARWLASGASDNSIVLWDSYTQQEYDLVHHDWFIAAEDDARNWWQYIRQGAYCGQLLLAFSPDNQRLATSLWDNTVRIWEIQQRQLVYILKNHNLALRALLFTPHNKRLLGVSAQGQVWDLAKGQVLYHLQGDARLINHAVLSRDGELLITASACGSVHYWHSLSGEPLRRIQAHQKAIYRVLLSDDNLHLVSLSADQTAKVWELASGQLKYSCQGHKAALSDAAFSRDGIWLATASVDKTVRIWDMRSGALHQVLDKLTAAILRVQFALDGQSILTVSHDLRVQIYSRNR